MKIGIFDSGLGGLVIAKSIFNKLPQYDYIYLGDTKNLPYGEKSPRQIYRYTESAVDFLFKQNCALIIVACNTSSAWALRKIQQRYLKKNYPDRRVLGVVIPTLEVADDHRRRRIGVIGTKATVHSHIYKKELLKLDNRAKIWEQAAPKLVPLIEHNSLQQAEKSLELYLESFKQKGIDSLILGCTHYPLLKNTAKKIMGRGVAIVSQDQIIPGKLADYLKRHKEISSVLPKNHRRQFLVTKINPGFKNVARRLFGKNINLRLIQV